MGLDDPGHLAIYDVSYLYIGMIGFFTTIISGLIISLIVGVDKYVTEVEYIFPCMRGFWRAGYKGIHSVPSYQALQMHIKATNSSLSDETADVPIKNFFQEHYLSDTRFGPISGLMEHQSSSCSVC